MKKLFKKLHIHNFSKPIACMYISFHTREIIFECKCGARKLKKEIKAFDEPFSRGADFVSSKEMKEILAGEKSLPL
jgi:hypothetical protein